MVLKNTKKLLGAFVQYSPVVESIVLEEAPTFFAFVSSPPPPHLPYPFVSLCTVACVYAIGPAYHSWRVARVDPWDDSKKCVVLLQYIRFTLNTLISVNKYYLQNEWSEKEEKIETTKFNAAGGGEV